MHTEQSFVNIFSCARRYLPETEENNFSKFGNFFRSLCVTSFKNTYRNVMAQSISNLQSKKTLHSQTDTSDREKRLFSEKNTF